MEGLLVQITQMLRRAVQTHRKQVATVHEGRGRTWEDFQARIVSLSAALSALGYQPGDRIGMLALNSDRYLEYFFAMAHGGFVFVPINTRLASPEIIFWLTDSGCSGLLIDDAFTDRLAQIRALVPDLRHIIHLGDGPAAAGLLSYEGLIAGHLHVEGANRGGDDLAGIFYTGGTTGRSKGVMLSHRNICANALSCAPLFELGADTVYLHAGPMFHLADGACTFIVTGLGGRHVFLPRFDVSAFLSAVAQHRVTNAQGVPTMINMIFSHPEARRADLSSLIALAYGGSSMPEAVIRRALGVLPTLHLGQAYGQTEAAPCMTFLMPKHHILEGPKAAWLKSAGLAALGCEVRIHDESDREVPRGTIGEICGHGDNIMLGYWRQPELTAHTLRNGWLHTGDLGFMDEDGFVFVVDRAKDMIISGGENIYSAEVEQALYSHPDVAECAVIGVPDEIWGENVHAVVRAKPEREPKVDVLIAHCKTLIANYKCPRSIEFHTEPLPL
jgi:acyl-CoA synthetase (AMP-forming)/AMP-acid ligase II